MTIIFAARAAMTLLKIGPTILKAKPIIFASRLSPSGQVAGGFVQSIATSKGISIALNSSGISTVIANKVIGVTLNPLTEGRISNVDSAGRAVVAGFREPSFRATVTAGGVLVNPLVGPVVLRDLALKAGVPSWVLFFF